MDMVLGLFVADAARFGHEVDEHFVGHPHHREFPNIARIKFAHTTIRQRGQRLENFRFVLQRWINQ